MPLLIGVLLARASRHRVTVLLCSAGMAIVIGGVLFALSQGISVATGLYWALTTASTVGYGDVTPHDGLGRLVAIAVMLTAIPLLGGVFALVAGAATAVHIRRVLEGRNRLPDGRYRIVYGMHPAVPRILEELTRAGDDVVLVAEGVDESSVPRRVQVLAGDPTSEAVVRKSEPERAVHALLVGEDGAVLITAVALRSIAPGVPVMALTRSGSVAQALQQLGVQHTLSAHDLLAHTLAKTLETPHAAELLLRIVDSDVYRLDEAPVADRWVDKALSDVRAECHELVLGVVHSGRLTLGIDEDPRLSADDQLLTLTLRTAARAAPSDS